MAFITAMPRTLLRQNLSSDTISSRKSNCWYRSIPQRRATTTVCATTNPADTESAPSKQVQLVPPPSTFYQAITQAQEATRAALNAGFRVLEIEFPPLPAAQLESSAVGAYDVSDANIRLVIDFAKKFAAQGKRIAMAFPDLVEKDRAVEMNNESEEPIENVRFSAIKDAKKGSFIERLWTNPEVEIAVREDDDMFIVLGASCQELPDVERLVNSVGERPVILFNLKLDTARGDLGLPAFPRKDLHFRFLSTVLPVYYLRTRTYSRSITRPPYVVNFSGALYKVYPGPYQVLLDTNAGNYERLSTLDERPPLGEVRDMLTDGMKIEGMVGRQGSVLSKGYKSMTWWEEDRTKAQSQNWRS
ncbi:Protein LOW PSII ACCUMULATION 3, chloroplastic [Gracilariopsis chorda]|uniref:Protein LOW PSII ACCUMULATION 3, chloroplastic n=1 Tax=Gracilariopsis chorda TaxID=448386 RepID=A0A2V3IW13_9FLOR|nr:Protein LOW PSII ACCUMULATION 3, chloroplastic [Gracilariopsis chorda]|eukprot:PXF46322.1 Protein LOW PSII ACCUMULATION 3, chloroplastic [Gracilariopsis chorda]